MQGNTTRRGLSSVLFFALAILLLLPSGDLLAGVVSFPQTTDLVVPTSGITVRAIAGSSADQVVVSGSSIAISLAAGDQFELHDPGFRRLSNTLNLPECAVEADGNHLILGPYNSATSVTVTPATTECGGGGGGGSLPSGSSSSPASPSTPPADTATSTPESVPPDSTQPETTNEPPAPAEEPPATNRPVNAPAEQPPRPSEPPAANTPTIIAPSPDKPLPPPPPPQIPTALGPTDRPVILTPTPQSTVPAAHPFFSGSAPADAEVKIRIDYVHVGTVKAGENGAWSYMPEEPLEEGGHVIEAEADGKLSGALNFVVDTIPPLPPEILEARIISSRLISPGLYSVTFYIQARVKETDIFFSFDGKPPFKGLTHVSKVWQTTLVATLATGEHVMRLYGADNAGNLSLATAFHFGAPSGAIALSHEVEGRLSERGPVTECSDGRDNDGDGAIDYPADRGCASREENEEVRDQQSLLGIFAKSFPGLAPFLGPILKIIENPQVQEINRTVVAPAAAAVVGLNAAATLPSLGFLSYLKFLFLQPLLLLRRRKGWGSVYNAMTKLPIDLAIVRLYDGTTGRILRSVVTDKNGRFLFFLQPGSYRVEVTKPSFTFPSSYLKGKTSDVGYETLYNGDVFMVSEASVFTPNIPVDPIGVDKPDAVVLREVWKKRAHTMLASSGMTLAGVIWIVSPSRENTIALALHILAFAAFKRLARVVRPKGWGLVRDILRRKPLHNSVVRIFEPAYNRILETQVTDASGRYAFLVGRNKYFVTYSRQGYQPGKTEVLDYTNAPATSVITENIDLHPVNGVSGKNIPPAPPSTHALPEPSKEVVAPEPQKEKVAVSNLAASSEKLSTGERSHSSPPNPVD